MKSKTFAVTFLLFLTIFFTSLLVISILFLNMQQQSAKERVQNEHYLISESMGKEFVALMERGANKENVIEYLYKFYSSHYARQKGYIEIYKENKLLYSSFKSYYPGFLSLDYENQSRTLVQKQLGNKKLTSVYGFAEYMQKSVLKEEERITIAGYIMEDSRYLLNIADRLLDLATLKKRSIMKKDYLVENLYQTAYNMLQKKLEEKDIHLAKESTGEVIHGDEDLLQSMYININNNAIDACEYGGVIRWKTYYEHGTTIISVSDNGKGIDSDDLDKIKEPFYRVDKSRNRAAGNAGLGLAICSQIAECHQVRGIPLDMKKIEIKGKK